MQTFLLQCQKCFLNTRQENLSISFMNKVMSRTKCRCHFKYTKHTCVDNMHQPYDVFIKDKLQFIQDQYSRNWVTNTLDFLQTSLWLLPHAILEMVWENRGPCSMLSHHHIQGSVILNIWIKGWKLWPQAPRGWIGGCHFRSFRWFQPVGSHRRVELAYFWLFCRLNRFCYLLKVSYNALEIT